jgi:plasmid maintenance system antidote protein VapI
MAIQHHPPHPGAILREDVLPALGLSVTEAARQLDYDMWKARQKSRAA